MAGQDRAEKRGYEKAIVWVGKMRRLTDLVGGSAVEGNAAGGTLTETIDVLITVGVVATVKGDGIESYS